MKLPVKHETSAGQLLGTASLEMVRSNLRRQIKNNVNLSYVERRRVLRELDFLIEYERMRRYRQAVHKWQRECLEYKLELLQKHCETVDQLRIARAKTEQTEARIRCEIVDLKLATIEKAMVLRKKYDSIHERDKELRELDNVVIRDRIAKRKEEILNSQIARRALNRAHFIKKVEEQFPDMAEELTDYYDQQVFSSETGR